MGRLQLHILSAAELAAQLIFPISLHVDLLHSVFYTSVPWLLATFTDLAGGRMAGGCV